MSKAEDLAGLLDANGDVLATNLDNVSVAFADVTSKPTTLAGYGITDAASDTELTNAVANSTNWDTAYGWGNHASAGYATTTYVDGEVANLVASAPATLDTLNELAAALGDDANFSTTVTNSIATKAPIDQPQFTYNSGAGEAARIDSSGNLLVGTTVVTLSDATSGSGIALQADGQLEIANSGVCTRFNRHTSDGSIVEFRKSGSTVGSIGVDNGDNIFIQGNSTHSGVNFGTNEILPYKNGAITSDTIALGSGTNRYTDLYLSNSVNLTNTSGSPALRIVGSNTGVCKIELGDSDNSSIGKLEYNHTSNYLDFKVNDAVRFRMEGDGDFHADGDVIAYSTTISDARLKDNIQGIENAVAKVSQLNGYTFEYKADGKVSAGVIAQEVEQVLPEAVSEKKLPLKTDDDQDYKVVNYDALHGLLIEAIKELSARVEALEAK